MNGAISYFRGLSLFLGGIMVGGLMMQAGAAQENRSTGLRLNHVGIAVKDFQESMNYYTKVMGFKVAFALGTPDKPSTTYLQISRDTFLEVAPASANALAGTITHIGIQADDEDATVTRLRRLGATTTDPRVSPQSKSKLANVTNPNGIRIELNELVPGSLTRQAVESWK
jgi:lactoylglutathione lyase